MASNRSILDNIYIYVYSKLYNVDDTICNNLRTMAAMRNTLLSFQRCYDPLCLDDCMAPCIACFCPAVGYA